MPPADRGGSASVLGRIRSPHSSGRPAEQLGQTDALAADWAERAAARSLFWVM